MRHRRELLTALSGGMLLFSAGCENEPKPSATATLTNNDAIHSAVQALLSTVASLQSSVAEFDTEDWRSVVPNVRSAASDVDSAVSSLRTALGYSE